MRIGNVLKGVFTLVLFVAGAAQASAQPPGGGGGPGRGPGGRPSFDKLLAAFDANRDEALEGDETPAPVWARLSQADANKDGYVTRKEFESFRP